MLNQALLLLQLSPCSLAGLELLAQEHFGMLAEFWELVHGSGTFISSLGLSLLPAPAC